MHGDLGARLERLGLAQYLDAFVAEGFDSWETLLDITESDLTSLQVKLGHRRKLQRAIVEARGPASRPLPISLTHTASTDSYRSDDSADAQPKAAEAPPKRRYRRHPKPDENAPERAPSAYVVFSNQVRESLRGQDLSFAEMAKVVGERWQVLAPDVRESCERQAQTAKDRYNAELAAYKKTPEYAAYQDYLVEFRAKHGANSADGKRSKVEAEANPGMEPPDRTPWRRMGARRAESSPSLGLPPPGLSPPPNHPYQSQQASAASHSLPGLHSHSHSPAASPPSALYSRHASMESSSRLAPTAMPTATTASTPQPAQASPQQPGAAESARRSSRDPAALPSLTREGSTLSSSSNGGTRSEPPRYPSGSLAPASLAPVLDAPRELRMLPKPVASPGLASFPKQHNWTVPTMQPPPDAPYPSSLAALIRAGELARIAEHTVDDNDDDSPLRDLG